MYVSCWLLIRKDQSTGYSASSVSPYTRNQHSSGEIEIIEREFGAFKRDRRALAEWARELAPERVVMESTGTYWKSPYAALEKVGIHAMVVNARHAKGVPGRKTDIADARWLATLARAGLLRGSFVPPAQMRQLRLVSRQRQKLVGQCSAEKNRLHKILTDAGIRLNVVVSDIHGQAARAMIKSLIDGRPLHEVLDRKGRLRAGREELLEALNTDEFSAVHRFVAAEILEHIEQLEQRIARQASLRSRERFWDIRVPKIDSIFDNSLVPRTSWSPGVPPQHRKLVAATHRPPI